MFLVYGTNSIQFRTSAYVDSIWTQPLLFHRRDESLLLPFGLTNSIYKTMFWLTFLFNVTETTFL